MLFADLLSLHLVTFLMHFILAHVTFFSSRCMLELNFAIYYRAASLPSQAFQESQAFFKHSPQSGMLITHWNVASRALPVLALKSNYLDRWPND